MFKRKSLIFLISICLPGLSSFSVVAQLDDPMRPPGHRLSVPEQKKASVATRYSLSLVQISSLRRSAVVNDRLVEVGDKVSGAKIIAIYPSSVKLRKKDKVFTIKLLSRAVKKRQRH